MSKEINKPKTKEPLTILLCGCKEKCFEQGKCWGHLEGVLCEHLEEHDVSPMVSVSVCGITKKIVAPYSTKKEYDALINMLNETGKK